MRAVVVLFGFLWLSLPAFSSTILVPGHYPSIQDALNAARDEDTIEVAPGTYYECIDFIGKNVRLMSSHGADVTVIDGNGAGSVVSFLNQEKSAVIEGFTITNGIGSYLGHSVRSGGGIQILNSSAIIRNNVITGNDAEGKGAAISLRQSSSRVTGNDIHRNTTHYGNPIDWEDGQPIIENNDIHDHVVKYAGAIFGVFGYARIIGNRIHHNDGGVGGIYIESWYGRATKAEISGNEICYNRGLADTGGIRISGDKIYVTLRNNFIYHNEGDMFGGGLSAGGGAVVEIHNCTFAYNKVNNWGHDNGGGAIACCIGRIHVYNSILFRNEAPLAGNEVFLLDWGLPSPTEVNLIGCCVDRGREALSSERAKNGVIRVIACLREDPLLRGEHDIHLGHFSPCRNAGIRFPLTPVLDFDGQTRDESPDIGADEFMGE